MLLKRCVSCLMLVIRDSHRWCEECSILLWSVSELEQLNKLTLCQTAWRPWPASFLWEWGLWWPHGWSRIPWRCTQLLRDAKNQNNKNKLCFLTNTGGGMSRSEDLDIHTCIWTHLSLSVSALSRPWGRGWGRPSAAPYIAGTVWDKSAKREEFCRLKLEATEMMKMISGCSWTLQSCIKNWHTAMTRSSEAEEKPQV